MTGAQSVAEILAEKAAALRPEVVPAAARERAEQLLIDVVGLCVAARNTDYIKALMAGVGAGLPCIAVEHATGFINPRIEFPIDK